MRADYADKRLYKALFAHMTYDNALALRTSLETGLRIGDVLALKPSDIRGRTIYYKASKTGKRGRCAVTKDLADRLRRAAGSMYVFESRTRADRHRSRQAVWRDVKRAAAALRAAGLLDDRNLSVHSARKTFAVDDMERHGLRHTQRALQHRDKSTTKLYALSDRYVPGAGCRIDTIVPILQEIERKIDIILTISENNGNLLSQDQLCLK